MTFDVRDLLRNTVAGYEAERLATAERDAAAIADLEKQLRRAHADAAGAESNLLDIIAETRAGIMAVLDMDPDHAIETACPLRIRTIAARAETALREAGRL